MKDDECILCDGTGLRMPEGCEICNGAGWVDDPSDGGTMTCPECDGEAGEPCMSCDGTGADQ